jgi:glucosamine--fructose-6-phosphate aminotransferase (isomerizing)
MSLTWDEIVTQYDALRAARSSVGARRDALAQWIGKARRPAVYLGCGSGYCLCVAGAAAMRTIGRRPAVAAAAGDVLLHAEEYEPMLRDAPLIAPSRSGRTSEVIRAVRYARERFDARTLGIIAAEDTPLAALSELTLAMPWAFDHSVCQTRTVSCLYLALVMLAAFAGDDEALLRALDAVIADGDRFIGAHAPEAARLARLPWDEVVTLADGAAYGLAMEGAMAVIEIAGLPASAYHLLDVRHGPMSRIGPRTLVIALADTNPDGLATSLIRDIADRGAQLVVYDAGHAVDDDCGAALFIQPQQPLPGAAAALQFLNLCQMLACRKAEELGRDPDHPDGLDPWIRL